MTHKEKIDPQGRQTLASAPLAAKHGQV